MNDVLDDVKLSDWAAIADFFDENGEFKKDAELFDVLNDSAETVAGLIQFKTPLFVGFFHDNDMFYDNELPHIAYIYECLEKAFKEDDFKSAMYLVARPYRLHYLFFIAQNKPDTITKDDVIAVFVDGEGMHINTVAWLMMFKAFGISNYANEDDKHIFDELDDVVTVYRGCRVEEEDTMELGFSFTLDKSIAEKFKDRDTRYESKIVTKRVRKSEIIFYTNDRLEQEVVIDSRNPNTFVD